MKVIYSDGSIGEAAESEELEIIRHTAAHIMAQAVKRLFPQAKFAFGPATENGFYYDVDLGESKLSDSDLENIENEMKKIKKENLKITPYVLTKDEAIKFMESKGETYKVQHIHDLTDVDTISFYEQGEYTDMCRGPHLCYTKELKAFKIMSVSGAYFKNDRNNKMLTRINGTAFKTKEELENYLVMLEEAEKRDHRKIGKDCRYLKITDFINSALVKLRIICHTKLRQRFAAVRRRVNRYGFVYKRYRVNVKMVKMIVCAYNSVSFYVLRLYGYSAHTRTVFYAADRVRKIRINIYDRSAVR